LLRNIGLVYELVSCWLRQLPRTERNKKTDVPEHPGVFDHVGLLANEPPGTAGLPFI